jgi:hypothetical protein
MLKRWSRPHERGSSWEAMLGDMSFRATATSAFLLPTRLAQLELFLGVDLGRGP